MSYTRDAREMALNYHASGHTLKETSLALKVSISTLSSWKKQIRETGSFERAPRERQPRKFPDDELRTYISEHPMATLKQISEEFGGSISGAASALRRLKISLKKGLPHTQNVTKKNGKSTENS